MSRFITTASGRKFCYDLDAVNDIQLNDIVTHLSRMTRFSGAAHHPQYPDRIFSVLQHSYNGAKVALKVYGRTAARDFAEHDFHEAFMGDITTPLSNHVDDLIARDIKGEIAERIDAQIFEALRTPFPLSTERAQRVVDCDRAMLVCEARTLIHGFKGSCQLSSEQQRLVDAAPNEISLIPMTPTESQKAFMELYRALTR